MKHVAAFAVGVLIGRAFIHAKDDDWLNALWLGGVGIALAVAVFMP